MSKERTIEDRVSTLEALLPIISTRTRKEVRTDCSRREVFFKMLEDSLESTNEPMYIYAVQLKIPEHLKKEIGEAQFKLLREDVFTAFRMSTENEFSSDCGFMDDNTLLVLCDEDIKKTIFDFANSTLGKDYENYVGMVFSIGGTEIIQHDSLSAIIARCEYALKKTSDNKTELCILKESK